LAFLKIVAIKKFYPRSEMERKSLDSCGI